MKKCSECDRPIQKPYLKVCSEECKTASRKRKNAERCSAWYAANRERILAKPPKKCSECKSAHTKAVPAYML